MFTFERKPRPSAEIARTPKSESRRTPRTSAANPGWFQFPALVQAGRTAGTVQRSCASCEKEDQERTTQRKAARAGAVEPSEHAIVPASEGRPLDATARGYFEPRFGCDFEAVRVHDGSQAALAARDLNATAYTIGRDIVFGAGAYAPDTRAGRRLIAHELTHVVQQGALTASGRSAAVSQASPGRGVSQPGDALEREADLVAESVTSSQGGLHGVQARLSEASGLSPVVQRDAKAPKPSSENVWGLPITKSMCGCRPKVVDHITWTETAAKAYAACDVPANKTGTDVEACFDKAIPGAAVVASTSASGTVTLPKASADPCGQIEDKSTFIHEIMHSRHTDDIARAQGAAFFKEWQKLAGDPDRLDKIRVKFPAETKAFEDMWHEGHDWAQDEVHSYTQERIFLTAVRGAIDRICAP